VWQQHELATDWVQDQEEDEEQLAPEEEAL
jgi:hypothetical protein